MDDAAASPPPDFNATALTSVVQPQTMDSFRQHVKAWMQIDDQVRELQSTLRVRRKLQKQLTNNILDFMRLHNIEDLNTQNGTLRYQVRLVKAPVNHEIIKSRLSGCIEPTKLDEVCTRLFQPREKVERVSLRRMRPS
jgi:uncharacterized protein YigA (DUF484 family)